MFDFKRVFRQRDICKIISTERFKKEKSSRKKKSYFLFIVSDQVEVEEVFWALQKSFSTVVHEREYLASPVLLPLLLGNMTNCFCATVAGPAIKRPMDQLHWCDRSYSMQSDKSWVHRKVHVAVLQSSFC